MVRTRHDDDEETHAMNDQIFETVVTTVAADGTPHVAPMGVRYQGERIVLMPFKPSTTHDNIVATSDAVLNIVTDTRVFAGCVNGRKQWPTLAAERVPGVRLACALEHIELRLAERADDVQRPVLTLARVHAVRHALFAGLNRAQAAVIEGAVLVSRLHMLPMEKIVSEWLICRSPSIRRRGPRSAKPGVGCAKRWRRARRELE